MVTMVGVFLEGITLTYYEMNSLAEKTLGRKQCNLFFLKMIWSWALVIVFYFGIETNQDVSHVVS
jgi:hypothetical protein